MTKLPSRGMCLLLARMYWDMPRRNADQTQLSWYYLIAWAFYEMHNEESPK